MGILLQINLLLQEQSAWCQVRLGLCSRIITACCIPAVSSGRRERLAASARIHSELRGRDIGYLSTMPHRNNPYGITLDSIEKAIRRHYHLSIRKLREFGNDPSRSGKTLKPGQACLSSLPKVYRGTGLISSNISYCGKELISSRRTEANLQASSSANRASASAITELRERPLPFAISRSPRARSRNNSRSCSERSYASMPIMTAAARPRWVTISGCFSLRNRLRTAAASWRRSVIGMIWGIFAINVPPMVRLTILPMDLPVNPYAL